MQFAPAGVPAGAHNTVLSALSTVFVAQFPQLSATQYAPIGMPVSLEVTSSQRWPGGQGNSPDKHGDAHKHDVPDFTHELPGAQIAEAGVGSCSSLTPSQSLSLQSHASSCGP